MEIKLTLELQRPKDISHDLVLTEVEGIYRPSIEQLKDTSTIIGQFLVSAHSDWTLKVEESDWNCDSFGDTWHCGISIYLKIIERSNGNIVDECFAWEMLGAPLYEEVFEPLYSCDWSSLENSKGIDLQFSSLKAVHNKNGDGLYFHYEVS